MSSKIKKVAKSTKKKSKRRSDINFESYIRKILKKKHHGVGINRNTVVALDRLVLSLADRFIERLLWLNTSSKKQTITQRNVNIVVRLLVPPGPLANVSVEKGMTAVTRYNASNAEPSSQPPDRWEPRQKGKISDKARITFPVSRVRKLMKLKSGGLRVGISAAIFLTTVLDFIIGEIVELAGNAARDSKKVRVNDRMVKLVILRDEELATLFKHSVLAGGVLPHINKELIKVKKEKVSDQV